MADTYSTNLKARLVEDNAYSTTWGQKLNTDALALIDDAVAGKESINLGTSTTYSLAALPNGSDSESRAAVLKFTGTPAGAVTVTIPATVTNKTYIVDNQCGQAITIGYSTGTAVAIANAGKLFVYADGSNAVLVNGYPRTDAERAASVTPVDYSRRTEPYDLRRYGVVFDSNGTTGNGTDNTTALRNAIKVAKQKGDKLTAPPGRARFTASITEFTDASLSTMASLHGDSKYNTIFFADFTPVTRQAGFSCDNVSGNRMYWSFKDFRMEGPAGTKGVGIYSNWGGFLSEFESLFFLNSADGLVMANNFECDIAKVDAVCTNNGIQIGYLLDNVTAARCNNISIFGGDTTLCGANGVFVFSGLNISAHGSSSEGNHATNFYFDSCEGVVLSGIYIETDPATTGTLTAQIYCVNCTAVVINGVTASAFKHGGEPIIFVEGCAGVTITGFESRSTGGPFNAVGVRVKGSTGVSVNGSSISDCASAIVLDSASASEIAINTTRFVNYTNSVVGLGAVAHKVQWNQAVSADVTASSFNAANAVDLRYTDNSKNEVQNTESFQISCSVAELNAGGKDIIAPVLSMERWRIVDIIVYNDTAFDAGGDRLVKVLDDTAVISYTTITAANLKAASAVNRWGSAVVPFPVSADLYTPTGASNKLRVKYSGGTTNYATGNLNITVTAMRVA